MQAAWTLAVATSEKSRYHYSRALVAKNDDNVVVGVLFGYPNTEEKTLDKTLQTILADKYSYHRWLFSDSEVFENEWYLDSIVVTDAVRGQGIGKQLIKAAEVRAKQENRETIGLNVDDANPRAQKLYTALGFEPVGKITIGKHAYTHMQKKI